MQKTIILRDPRHHHDPAVGDIMLGELKARGVDATLTEDVSVVARLEQEKAGVLVLYTQGDTFAPQQVEALTKWVRGGGRLVGVHCATATNKTDDKYAALLGSRFIGHGPVFEFTVNVSDADHLMAHRIQDYRITDELYISKPFGEFDVFLTAWWEGKKQPMGYTKSEGKGRVVYLANGHDARAASHKTFKQLLLRAVRYAAGEDWSKKTMKVAAIGYGGAFNMGKLHLESCKRARMTPVAVAEPDAARREVAKKDFGESMQVYASADDLLAKSDAELCLIITPHNTHAPIALQCLSAGRHVVSEKPFTINVDEATAVIESARKNKRMATVFHNRRWDGDFLAIRRIVESGVIGDIFHIECSMTHFGEPSPGWWRSYKDVCGGIMHDWGAHFWDWMLQLMPHKIESITGDFRKKLWHQVSVEDHGVSTVRFAGGRTAQMEMSSIAAIGKSRFRILGTQGGIEQKGWDEKDGITVVTHREGVRTEMKVPYLKSDWDGFYRNVADHLLAGEELFVKPEEARRVIAAICIAQASSEKGCVPLPVPFEQ